jgi:hypothetical protein
MAQLLQALSISGALKFDGTQVSSGRAWFFIPGSASSQQVVYADADGLYPLAQPVAFDAGGRCTVYTKSTVRIQIEDQNGVLINVYDRGNTTEAPSVEIENVGYTGIILSGGAAGSTGAGGRTDLDTVLGRLYASTGGVDGQYQVLSTSGARIGAPRLLTAAISDISVNVKSFLCGDGLPVAGDGLHVDTTGIQAVMNYVASKGGGTVLFPPGTYLIDQPLTLTAANAVSLIGAGRGASIIKNTNGITGALVFSTCTNFIISGLRFTCSGTSTGTAISIATNSTGIILDGIGIDDQSVSTGTYRFGIDLGSGCSHIQFRQCSIITVAGDAAARGIRLGVTAGLTDVSLFGTSITSNAGVALEAVQNATSVQMFGGIYLGGAGSIKFSDATSASWTIVSSQITSIDMAAVGSNNSPIILQTGTSISSANGYSVDIASGGTVTPDLSRVGTDGGEIRIRATSTGVAFTINAPTPRPVGRAFTLKLIFFNNAGAPITGWGLNAIYHVSASPSVTDNQFTGYLLTWDPDSAVLRELGRSVTS